MGQGVSVRSAVEGTYN